jgi:hypothetical protein
MPIITLSAAVGLVGSGCDPKPPAPSVPIPTIRPGAVDDTFACLSEAGPLIEIRGKQDYEAYKNRSFADNTRFDADGALWYTRQAPDYKTLYPINIGGGEGACWAGGIVLGTNPYDSSWGQLYAKISERRRRNSASIVWTKAPDFVLDGIRIHNTWDAARIRPDSGDFTIKNVWITYNRDDCVENDNLQGGVIDDSLFDGCYVAFSARGGPKSDNDGSDNVWTIQNSLIRLGPMPGAHNEGPDPQQPGHKGWFKWRIGKGPKLVLHNNVFMVEQRSNMPDRVAGIPPLARNGDPEVEIVDCRNNVMVWLGEGEYPYHLHDCFTVTKDRSIWERAKQDWIERHPKVPRLPDDPQPAASHFLEPSRSLSRRRSRRAAGPAERSSRRPIGCGSALAVPRGCSQSADEIAACAREGAADNGQISAVSWPLLAAVADARVDAGKGLHEPSARQRRTGDRSLFLPVRLDLPQLPRVLACKRIQILPVLVIGRLG